MLKHKTKNKTQTMLNFRTAILLVMFVNLSTLHSHTTEGKVQMIHRHHSGGNNKNHNHHKNNSDIVIKQNQHRYHHHNLHHRHHEHENEPERAHLHSHQSHHESQQRKYAATPILEFTTSSSAAIQSDDEFLIKQPEEELAQQLQQQENLLISKDEIRYKTKELKSLSSSSSTSSTTSQPTFSIHLIKQQNDHKIKSENLINSLMEHTRHISIPSTLSRQPDVVRGSDNTTTITTSADPYERSKLNLAKHRKVAIAKQNEQHQQQHNQEQLKSKEQQQQQQQQHKPEYERKQQTKHINEDYYGDDDGNGGDGGDGGENDRNDEQDDTDEIEYIDDDDENIDNISYDETSLSDRSYARIIRSKIEDDYADDEPYQNVGNDLQMQSDAAPGVLTEQKYLEVGNDKAVQQARERYVQEQKRPRTPHELATEHWHRMIQATKCRKPLPRVIPVSNNTSKRYEPYATILHRCGDDTGCCGSTASICTVKRYETVMVYVFSYDFNYRKEIEALPMQNHTECHCVNRGSLLHDSIPRDKRSGGSYSNRFQRQQRKPQSQLESHSYSQYQLHQQPQLQDMFDCHCPKHFDVFEEDMERHAHLPRPHKVFIRKCRCDCAINNQTCFRFKNGEEGFSLEDRKCIQEHDCKPPVCLYGDYNSRIGRCPSYRSSHLL